MFSRHQKHARRLPVLLVSFVFLAWGIWFSFVGKIPEMEHDTSIIDDLPSSPRMNVSSEYEEIHEEIRANRIGLFPDPNAILASWGDLGAIKQWVRKDSIILGSRFIHNWAKWAAGGNNYDAVAASTQYESDFADDTYMYNACLPDDARCGLWNYLARYGQYTVAVTYNGRRDLSEEEFEQLVAHVDRHVADVLSLRQ